MLLKRKERRVQKALGLAEYPFTIREHIDFWVWDHKMKFYEFLKDGIWRWIAFKLPRKLVYHVVIRLWAHATCCDEGKNECVHDTTVDNAIRRWEFSK